MRSSTFVLGILFLFSFAGACLAEENKPQVYLLIGQSNMAGRAPIAVDQTQEIPRCLLLDPEGQWEPARNPLNRHSSIRKGLGIQKVNPGYSFAQKMLADDKALTLGLVVNAKGGTSIKQWKKDGKFYDAAVRRSKEGQAAGGELAGVLWHQGESDSEDTEYLAKLKVLISNLRKDLGKEDLPFVAGQINKHDLINKQVAVLPTQVPHTATVSSEGLTCSDRWHFDSRSMKVLGERYAEAVQKLNRQN